MSISILDKDIKNNILNMIEYNLLLVTFYGNRESYLMKGLRDSNGNDYVSGEFCEQIFVNNEEDISRYIRNRLLDYVNTGNDNIFNSLYKSSYCNQYLDSDYHPFLHFRLRMNNYNWLKEFKNLDLTYWDKGTKFNINIEPFNKIKIV